MESTRLDFIQKDLAEKRSSRRDMKRCSSLHVGSRWYRAPEIALVEKQYDQASDMWSFGCIIFELLQFLFRDKQWTRKEF